MTRSIRVLVVDDAVAVRRAVSETLARDPSIEVVGTAANGRIALAVVLTGMGRDGFRGCEEIRARGGEVLVQDQESSVVWGMPGFVASAGIASQVLPLTEMSGEIVRRVSDDHRSGAVTGDGPRSLAGGGA